MTSPNAPAAEFCVFCGQALLGTSNFCTTCGKARRKEPPDPREGEPQVCGVCASVEAPNVRYCSRCGKPLVVTDRRLPVTPPKEPTSLNQDIGSLMTAETSYGSEPTDAMGSITTILSTGDRGPTFPLALTQRMTVGRGAADMTFAEDRYMSPLHCEVQGTKAGLMARDLGSLNGTFLRLRQTATVGEGATLILGHQVLRLRRVRPVAPQVMPDGSVRRGSAARATAWAIEQLDASGAVRDVFHLQPQGGALGRQVGDIRFAMDTFVSTEHCRFEVEGDRVKVTDLKSSNGTWLRLQSPVVLRDGDQLLAGFTILHFHLPQTGAVLE